MRVFCLEPYPVISGIIVEIAVGKLRKMLPPVGIEHRPLILSLTLSF